MITLRSTILSIALVVSLGATTAYAQPNNDICDFATFIPSVDGFCSDVAAYSNVGATSDPVASDLCFLDYTNGVWFSFIPREPAVDIRVFGAGVASNSIISPKIAIFNGCGNYVNCSPGSVTNINELVISGLQIGQVYYLMVESAPGGEGSFQLCINDFVAPPSPQSDCNTAVILCDKSPFTIANLDNVGQNPNEAQNSCIGGERASSWYKWICDEPGTLTMELIPSNLGIVEQVDDLDFIIYELPDGIDNCNTQVALRCMGSGANTTNGVVDPVNTWPLCNRATGMRDGETDTQEQGGCQGNSNNYIRPLDMQSGRAYALLINNFSTSGLGFSIEFGGTGTFLGPDLDVAVAAVQAFECDKTIIFSQDSESPDPIVSYTWNFGAGSTPSFSNDTVDIPVVYESFGTKTAALTVETSRGCTVTEIIDLDVAACCADTSTLDIEAQSFDVDCFGDLTGLIESRGLSGSPRYEFSLDGVTYQPNPNFNDLGAGEYTVQVRDQKGCTAFITVTITEPEELTVDAGEDITVDLGSSTMFDASYSPPGRDVTIEWSNPDTFDGCDDCLGPTVTPTNNGTYTITVTDENGCTAVSQLRVNVEFDPEITAPNIFSPNGSDNPENELFNLFGDIEVEAIQDLLIYDRWGNLVYAGSELTPSDRSIGWDGTFNGSPAEQGVYTWLGKVRYINNEVVSFAGDITLVR